MSNVDTSSWKEFLITDLFEFCPVKSKLTKLDLCNTGVIPVYSSETSNNGINGYTDVAAQFIVDEKTPLYLVFGDHTRSMNIAEESFCVMDNVKVLKPKCSVSVETLLYISTVWKKAIPDLGYARHWSVAKDLSIKLPVKEVEEIDWEYMQEYITELEQERITELEQYLIATGLNDYKLTDEDKKILATKLTDGEVLQSSTSGNGCLKEARMFKVGDLFEKINPRFYGKPNTYIGRKSCTTTKPDATHTVPLTCAKYDNNGVMYYGDPNLFESVANCLVMIRDGAVSTGLVFAHEDPVGVLSHSYLMKCKVDVSFRSLLYISSVMTKTLYPRYNRSDPSYWDGKVENDKILLPATCDSVPDWAYMENYIRAIEKVVIKDVVDWKDAIIKETKKAVANAV